MSLCPSAPSLAYLQSKQVSITHIVRHVPVLSSSCSLQSVTTVFDDTVFVDCPNLKSLVGLGSLSRLGKDLVLRNLKSLASTAGLSNITSVGK